MISKRTRHQRQAANACSDRQCHSAGISSHSVTRMSRVRLRDLSGQTTASLCPLRLHRLHHRPSPKRTKPTQKHRHDSGRTLLSTISLALGCCGFFFPLLHQNGTASNAESGEEVWGGNGWRERGEACTRGSGGTVLSSTCDEGICRMYSWRGTVLGTRLHLNPPEPRSVDARMLLFC